MWEWDAAPALSVSEPLWWGGEPSPHQLRAGEQIDARIAVAAACAAVSYCAHAAGYTPGAGSFNNPCGRLRSLGGLPGATDFTKRVRGGSTCQGPSEGGPIRPVASGSFFEILP